MHRDLVLSWQSQKRRYNLKRKIANMPPVTREWFEARKETLAASTGATVAKIWTDPLTKKKFGSENTYKAFVNSKKYKDLVKQSGQPAPQPAVSLRRVVPAGVARNGLLFTSLRMPMSLRPSLSWTSRRLSRSSTCLQKPNLAYSNSPNIVCRMLSASLLP